MYQKSYDLFARDSPQNYRKIERDALLRAIDEIEKGLTNGPESTQVIKACAVMQSIWTIILSDLMSDENKLPLELRAKIISIGLWIQRELTDIETGKSTNFSGVIEINKIIADGLQ